MDHAVRRYLGASLCCISAIGGLSSQSGARMGNALGMLGVSTAVYTTLYNLYGVSFSGYLVIFNCLIVGGGAGAFVAARMPITSLPQMVAAFHSLVGIYLPCISRVSPVHPPCRCMVRGDPLARRYGDACPAPRLPA